MNYRCLFPHLSTSSTRLLVVATLLGLGVQPKAVAQKAWSLVVAPQVHATRHVFAGHSLVSPRLWLRPTIGFAGTLGLRYGLSQQLSLEGGIGPRSDGLKIASVADYPAGRRFETVGVSTIRFTSPQVQLVLLYRTLSSDNGAVWVSEAGLDAISHRYVGVGGFGTVLSTNAGQPQAVLTGLNQSKDQVFWRFGVRAGVGREWQVGTRHFLGLKVLGSVGLQEFARWQLQYSFPEDGSSKTYQNTVYTKLGYLGFHTWYRFQL